MSPSIGIHKKEILSNYFKYPFYASLKRIKATQRESNGFQLPGSYRLYKVLLVALIINPIWILGRQELTEPNFTFKLKKILRVSSRAWSGQDP